MPTSNQLQPISIDRVPNLIRVPRLFQTKYFTCGPCALQSVFYYYGLEFTEEQLEKKLRAGNDHGTYARDMARVPEELGFSVSFKTGMAVGEIKHFLDQKIPAVLLLQAWAEPGTDYTRVWNHGHFVVAIGYDDTRIFLMDPSTLGHYTYVLADELPSRWHRREGDVEIYHCGIAIAKNGEPSYDPDRILPMP